jgi:hypothetical protein
MSDNQMPPVTKEDWWVLFPIWGVTVSDPSPGLDSPLWGDATLVSTAHLPTMVKRLKMNDRTKAGHDHEGDLLFMLGAPKENLLSARWPDRDHVPSGYLAIRRRLERTENVRPGIPRSAAARAACIEAGLAFGMLTSTRDGMRTCGIAREGRVPLAAVAAIDFASGGLLVQVKSQSAIFGLLSPAASFDYAAIPGRLASSRTPTAVATLLAQPTSKDSQIVVNLRHACCRLASACFATNPERQVVGAVTSLEMLLSNDGDFGRLKVRSAALVADVADAQDVLNLLLKARHEHVHQGREVDPEVGRASIPLLMQIVERVARCQSLLESKVQLCAFLDARSAIASLGSNARSIYPALQTAPWDDVNPSACTG